MANHYKPPQSKVESPASSAIGPSSTDLIPRIICLFVAILHSFSLLWLGDALFTQFGALLTTLTLSLLVVALLPTGFIHSPAGKSTLLCTIGAGLVSTLILIVGDLNIPNGPDVPAVIFRAVSGIVLTTGFARLK